MLANKVRTAIFTLCQAVFFVLVLWTVPAHADSAAQARHHDEEARKYFAQDKFDAALREFFFVQRIAPTTTTLYNIALCFRRLNRDDDEFNSLQEYLSGADDDPERRRFAEERIEKLRASVAQVEVKSEPAGAGIFIDREELGEFGKTPMIVAVNPGTHKILVRRPGYAPFETEANLKVGEHRAVEAELQLIEGRVTVSAPSGSSIVLQDAKAQVVASANAPGTIEVPPGSYTARIEAPGFQTHRGLLEVRANEETKYTARLVPLPPPSGEVTFTSNAPGALVSLDGQVVGFAPLVLTDVPVGAHQIAITKPGLLPYNGSIEVVENKPAWLTTTLEKEQHKPIPKPVFWSTVGLSAASLATWGVFSILTAETHQKFKQDPTNEDLSQQGKTFAAVADGFLIAGTVLAVTSVVFWALNKGEQRPSSATTVRGRK